MQVAVRTLGEFSVRVDDGEVPAGNWHRRSAAALVKLLALSPHARLHRDRVLDALWPDLDVDQAVPRLHKAAHYAREALGAREAVVLRNEVVALFPYADLEVDVAALDAAADLALRPEEPDAELCAAALSRYTGELLPEDLHEPWTDEPRARVRSRVELLLRGAARWDDLLALDPANEEAHVELLRSAVFAGDRAAALRRYDEMADALARELGISPSPEATALRERALVGPTSAAPRREAGPAAPYGQLLERDRELGGLATLMSTVIRRGRGAVVLVTGEAGSGKSALVRAFLDALDETVARAFGECDDLLAPRSLGPIRDMAVVHPELGKALASSAPMDELLPALLTFLARQPTAVVVEDVHWADDASLDAIRFLSRRIPGMPAVLLLTYRPGAVDPSHPLQQLVGGLPASSVTRIELGALSVDAVGRLAGTGVDAVEVHRVTQGNPFFVTEVLATGDTGVPTTVRDAVMARLGRLAPPTQSLVERLSVVPSRAERWLAEELAGGDVAAVIEAERSGVLAGDPGHVSFRHEIARLAIEESLTVAARVEANRAVIDVLVGHGEADRTRIVHHAERSGRVDLLLHDGPAAAEESARAGAHRQAAETLRVVLEHADRLEDGDVASLLTRRAYSLYVVNQYEAALADADKAVVTAEEAENPMLLADALIVLSRVVMFASGPGRAREAAQRAVDILETAGDDARLAAALNELARAHSNLPTVGIVSEPSGDTADLARRALELSWQAGRDDLVAQALCYIGSGRMAAGDLDGAEDLDRALAASQDSRGEIRVRAHVNAAGSAYRAGRLDDADRYIAAGLRLADDSEFSAGRYRLLLTRASVLSSRGDWDGAVSELRGLVALPGQPGVMVLLAQSILVRLLARRGDPDARAVLDQALSDPRASGDCQVAGPLAVAQVELAWLTGTVDGTPEPVADALQLAIRAGNRSVQSELCGYLRRAELDWEMGAEPVGPWSDSLAGRWREAAAAWEQLGERYEQAVELALGGGDASRELGMSILAQLGAHATLAVVSTST